MSETQTAETTLYCFYHPNTPTSLRCNRCDKPICPKDAVRTPTGYRCKDCVRQQQDVFFNATPLDYAITAVVAFLTGLIGQAAFPRLGFLIIFIGPLVGGLAGEVIWRLSRKRRGRYIWLTALIALSVGSLLAVYPILYQIFSVGFVDFFGSGLVWQVVYFALAATGVVTTLRVWRR